MIDADVLIRSTRLVVICSEVWLFFFQMRGMLWLGYFELSKNASFALRMASGLRLGIGNNINVHEDSD